MIKVEFEFDPLDNQIKNLRVHDNSIELSKATVSVGDGKITLSKGAQILMGLIPGDRVTISYYMVNEEETFPVIGKSDLFSDDCASNKLTKSNTISFRGEQRKILLEYGNEFSLEPFQNYYKMVKIEGVDPSNNIIIEN